MKLTNAIKKLSKFGEVQQNGQLFWVQKNQKVIEFMANGKINNNTNITCIRVRYAKDEDDTMTDYFSGTWCDNLTQAIRLAGF